MQATAGAQAPPRANAESASAPAAAGAVPAAAGTPVAGRDLARRQASGGNQATEALEPIRELLREGRRTEARQALERWQQDWPDAVVPEDLRTLLQ